jgi:hypothetical protein
MMMDYSQAAEMGGGMDNATDGNEMDSTGME